MNIASKLDSLKIKSGKKGSIIIHGKIESSGVCYELENSYYLPCFLGISYLVDRWGANARRKHRRLPFRGDFVNYAEANVMKGFDFYQSDEYSSIDIQALVKNAKKLKERLIDFKRSEPVILSKSEGKLKGKDAKTCKLSEFSNYLDMIQYMFSNGIVMFLKHLGEFNKKYPDIFPNDRTPFLPFSHLPFHSLRYAFGEKNPYADYALPPMWDQKGKPRKPHVGKFSISIHPLSDFLKFDQPNVVPYLTQAAGVSASFDVGPEYEVSFLSHFPKDRIFKQKLIRYPSFHHLNSPQKYLAKYGLNNDIYQGFKEGILNPTTCKNATNVLKTWLCLFHAIKSMYEVSEEIRARDGRMLFLHPNGDFLRGYPTEKYESTSKTLSENNTAASQDILTSESMMRDTTSWGDIRSIYKTPKTPSPRKPPSGSKPSGKRLNLSTGSSYSGSIQRDEEEEISFSFNGLKLNFDDEEYNSQGQNPVEKRDNLPLIFSKNLMENLPNPQTNISSHSSSSSSAVPISDIKNTTKSKFSYYSKSDVSALETLVVQKDVQAIRELGVRYHGGIGVKIDVNKSSTYFLQASEAGDEFSKGRCFQFGYGERAIDFKSAFECYQKVADYPPAQAAIAWMYFNGEGIAADHMQAKEWCQKAANSNNAPAQWFLGCFYQYGQCNLIKDFAQAKVWFQKSADQGYERASKKLQELSEQNESKFKP